VLLRRGAMDFKTHDSYTDDKLLEIYEAILKPRIVEEKMLKLLRQGQISKWFSGIGQEAIAVGVTLALNEDEYIFPLHRNLGVFTTRNIPLRKLFQQWRASPEGFTNGRDRSFHFGSIQHHIVGMISHLGAMLSVADGVALSNKIDNKQKVTVAFSGDGGTSEGDFHEALNLAAVWDLPVIFVVENNGYGLSTPSSSQFRCEHIASKGIGYGIESAFIDGNNILEVYAKVNEIAEDIRQNPRPFLLECKTFRMRGHEEASGTKYVPKDLQEKWAVKDPVQNFKSYLTEYKNITEIRLGQVETKIVKDVDQAVKVFKSPIEIDVNSLKELADVYQDHSQITFEPKGETTNIRFIDAISDGLRSAMTKYDSLVLMGQDIADYGGVFKITDGFLEEFGTDRVGNTPISESAPLGAALGLSIAGKKAMVEMQFADFVSCGFNQIINNIAKNYYRWNQNCDVVIRMPTGGGTAAGPFHSQSNEAWFFHTPGLKIVYPSNPNDAKGLLLAAFEDPNPVLFFEHKGLYRTIEGEVPMEYYTLPIGTANTEGHGSEIAFISYGWAVHWCREVIEELDLNARLVDLRSLVPWDIDAVQDAVQATGKVIIVHEDTLRGGIGGEIAAWIGEHCFRYLDAPVVRVGSLDTPVPFNADLEANFLGKSRLKEKVIELIDY